MIGPGPITRLNGSDMIRTAGVHTVIGTATNRLVLAIVVEHRPAMARLMAGDWKRGQRGDDSDHHGILINFSDPRASLLMDLGKHGCRRVDLQIIVTVRTLCSLSRNIAELQKKNSFRREHRTSTVARGSYPRGDEVLPTPPLSLMDHHDVALHHTCYYHAPYSTNVSGGCKEFRRESHSEKKRPLDPTTYSKTGFKDNCTKRAEKSTCNVEEHETYK